MPRRMILTDAERQNFLALPSDDDTLIRHWSLDDEDHRLLETRRRDDTRLGLALQLCALRYPGRLIQRGEVIPESALTFLAEQLRIEPNALASFARRAPTRYEQLTVLRQHYGFSELSHPLRTDLLLRVCSRRKQEGLTLEERLENVANAFQTAHPEQLENKRILLIDDVCTTGSTMNAACDALRAAGAVELHCLVFARV